MIKKLISSKDRLSGVVSSSSSEKVYSVTNTSNASGNTSATKANNSSKKLIHTVKEKFDHVTRGRRRSSKEPSEPQSEQENLQDKVLVDSDKGPDMAIAELDSVINSYHSATSSNGNKMAGNGKLLSYVQSTVFSVKKGGQTVLTTGSNIQIYRLVTSRLQ